MPAPGAGARIEAMTGAHAAAVLAIYQSGIEEGNGRWRSADKDLTDGTGFSWSRPGAVRGVGRGG
jgi:hypothetical protein